MCAHAPLVAASLVLPSTALSAVNPRYAPSPCIASLPRAMFGPEKYYKRVNNTKKKKKKKEAEEEEEEEEEIV